MEYSSYQAMKVDFGLQYINCVLPSFFLELHPNSPRIFVTIVPQQMSFE